MQPDGVARPVIAATVEAALRASCVDDGPLWLPGVGLVVCAAGRERFAEATSLTRATYGTQRVRLLDAFAPRLVAQEVAPPEAFVRPLPILVETLGPTVDARYADLGLVAAPKSFAASVIVAERLRDAFARIAAVGSLAEAVGRLVDIVHVVVPEGPDYDIGYSDPEVPFSVWVGIGEEDGRNGPLRLAEGLVHEAMHLQLSLVEACVPLVRPVGAHLPSPWRDEPRPVGGVLHGAYVFAVVGEYMEILRGYEGGQKCDEAYVVERIETSRRDVALAVEALAGCRDLTEAGRALVSRISRYAAGNLSPCH